MHSSTSNSEPATRIAGRPTLAALALAAAALIAAAAVRTPRERPPEDGRQPPPADIVLVGDSHVRQGIIPSSLSERLGGVRVACIASPGTPLSEEFVSFAESRLDPASRIRCIAVGVTLSTQKVANRQLSSRLARAAERGALETLLHRLAPVVAGYQGPKERSELRVNRLHEDGWRERDFVERRPPGDVPAIERWSMLASPFDRRMVGKVRAALASAAGRGITVVTFTMPSDLKGIEPMAEEWAGMTALDIAQAILPPGGVAVELGHRPGDTYDGHHLAPEAARRISGELADALAGTLGMPQAGAGAR